MQIINTVFSVIVMMAYAYTGLSQEVGGFTKEVIVTIPWGTEPGEVGKIPTIRGRTPGGPASFDVDSQNTIYLLDAGNKRVLVYAGTGELMTHIQLDTGYFYGSSVIKYCEENDAVYIHNFIKKIFSVYAIHGDFLQRIRYNGDIGPDFKVENGKIIGVLGILPLKTTSRLNNIYSQDVQHDYEGDSLGILKSRNIDNYIDDSEVIVSRGYYVERPFVINDQGDIYTLKLDDDGAKITRYNLNEGM